VLDEKAASEALALGFDLWLETARLVLRRLTRTVGRAQSSIPRPSGIALPAPVLHAG
jgi:hypothetical protein